MSALFLFYLSKANLNLQSVRCFKAQLSYMSLVLFTEAGRCCLKRVLCSSNFTLAQESTSECGIQEKEVSATCP